MATELRPAKGDDPSEVKFNSVQSLCTCNNTVQIRRGREDSKSFSYNVSPPLPPFTTSMLRPLNRIQIHTLLHQFPQR